MNYTEHKITLDIHQTVAPVALRVKKGDTGRRLLIHLAERGYPYHISQDCYAVFTAKKPDGKVVFNNCSIKECVIGYDFTAQTVAVAGLVDSEIILYGADGKQITSASFHIIVEDTIYDTETEIESTDEYNALADLIGRAQKLFSHGPVAQAVVRDAEGKVISITDASNQALQGLHIFGKSAQGAVPTLEAPVEIVNLGAEGEIAVKVAGRNLLPNKISTNVTDAITVTSNADGTMTLTGTTIESKRDLYMFGAWTSTADFGVRGPVTLSVEGDDDLTLYMIHNSEVVASGKKMVTLNVTDKNYITAIFMRLVRDVTYNETIKVMLSAGATAPEWEPYRGIQELPVATLNGLAGIPVASGGNYTDNNGQQWICDEIDLARGKYVQRILRFNPGDYIWAINKTWTAQSTKCCIAYAYVANTKYGKIISTHFADAFQNSGDKWQLGCAGMEQNRILYVTIPKSAASTADEVKQYLAGLGTVFYAAAINPIEKDLTAEDIAAFAALHSYKLNTTISNDAGAYMAAEYVADTKTYIDRRPGGASGSMATIGEVTLLAANWVGTESPYSQVVEIEGVTEYSQVDLTPSVAQLSVFHNKDLAFVTENDGGSVTVYAIGQKPENDYTIQVTITEVYV